MIFNKDKIKNEKEIKNYSKNFNSKSTNYKNCWEIWEVKKIKLKKKKIKYFLKMKNYLEKFNS